MAKPGVLAGVPSHAHSLTMTGHTHDAITTGADTSGSTISAGKVEPLGVKGLPGVLAGEKHKHPVTMDTHPHGGIATGTDDTDLVDSSGALGLTKPLKGLPGLLPGVRAHLHILVMDAHLHSGCTADAGDTASVTETGTIGGVRAN